MTASPALDLSAWDASSVCLLPAPPLTVRRGGARLRSAAAADTTPQVPAPPKPTDQMTPAELASYRSVLLAEADQIAAVKPADRTPEQTARFGTLVGEAERVSGLHDEATTQQRLAAMRSRQSQPTRPAPTPSVHVSHRSADGGGSDGEAEAFALWMRSFSDQGDFSPDASYRAAQHGYALRSASIRVGGGSRHTLNKAKLRALSRGGVGAGKELVPASTMAERITDYLSFFSPILGVIDSEVTDDGNDRDYPIIDDTALISSLTTASGGTETNPTIPDRDVATGMKKIRTDEYTSGYHKMTRQALQDSPIGIMERVARGIANSDARAMERAFCVGSGNTEGITAVGTQYGTVVNDLTYTLLEQMYFAIPEAYRPGVTWLFSPKARTRAVNVLKDSTGRSLFGKTVAEGIEVQTLFERPVYVSEFMPAWAAGNAVVSLFHPAFYLMRPVRGRQVDMLDQKFHPLLALASIMRFGGAWLGPSTANLKLVLGTTPVAVP